MHLELSETQARLLEELVDEHVKELQFELARADVRAAREELRQRLELLEHLQRTLHRTGEYEQVTV